MTYLPVALTIAGTDPSGGAGIMADLKSFQARDVYGMAVVTSLVAQNTRGVQLIEHVSNQMLKAQLESVFSDIKPQAVKTGMLATTEIMEIIQPYLKKLDCPYVLDPV
ncbi:MAG: bifunctional hydroxymethylpyrimidine kinase/phosphomethylpyrimidine kinase, partial [Streptococcus sp.]|nr:bifunctional hydroxymethylpyrimidine kinase/phosphomethylpyrimidine kinase [Streptococcus sp.]